MHAPGFFKELVAAQKGGNARGIASICSAHRAVLEAAILEAARDDLPLLVESTVNQVNQFGGYTGMTPAAFRDYVFSIADEMSFPRGRLMLGCDHLGPYPWRAEPAAAAMKKSRDLAAMSVQAGYAKIHLDASMPLGGDTATGGALDPRTIADREGELAEAAEAAADTLGKGLSASSRPVYVIGTEVPAPGGSVSPGGGVAVTGVDELRETVAHCGDAFARRGLAKAWKRVCAVVAQPGVEYGDQDVHEYDRTRAAALCAAARGIPGIVLEGHSTDYQPASALRALVEDGIAILKVGPALTFAMRESLFALEAVEREMLHGDRAARLSDLSATMERAMLADPAHWKGYYHGSEHQQWLARRYSFSDRCRYYWAVPSVRTAVETLVSNLQRTTIPLSLLSQFLPFECRAVREGRLASAPMDLVRESVRRVIAEYSRAAGPPLTARRLPGAGRSRKSHPAGAGPGATVSG